jgi:hypothetical protein
MARTKNTQAQQEVPDSHVASPTNVSSSDTFDARTPTPPSTSALRPDWVEKNGVYYPFPAKAPEHEESGAVVDTVQFKSVGIATSSYLNAGSLAHTMKWKPSDGDFETLEEFLKSSPIPSDGPDFHLPVKDGVAVANNKDDLTSPFGQVYDGRNKALDDLDEDDLIPAHRIRPGVKVCVEYTPTVWSVRKSRDGGPAKFGSGCSLKLQAVVLLEDGFNFGSPRKRRKLAQ